MCTPAFPWNWFILDVAYVLVLLGGSMILRARQSRPLTWATWGALSFTVGAFLFSATLDAQTVYGAAVASSSKLLEPCT